MSAQKELSKISDQITKIFAKSVTDPLPYEVYASTLKRLVMEAEAVISLHFGPGNSFSLNLIPAMQANEKGFLGRSLMTVMGEANQIIFGAINHMIREPLLGVQFKAISKPVYVDASTISAMGELSHPEFDFSRLIQMCRELNTAHQSECHISVIFLVRAIIDHIPPIFGENSFAVAANKLPHSKKKTFLNLQNSSRNIADSYLHQHIRRRENQPTATEVNFSQDLSVVLGEVINAVRSA
ncbi:MAG: hypothetical protein EOS11_19705 [Mesorhizobium sp.]|nr:MAG: hypothetical protein EOS11_19705 [Mesorhizobium sp.]